jgi:arabinofuranan 3-O-arabinosyltransferase
VTWIYAPRGAALDATALRPNAQWHPSPTGSGEHSLQGDGSSLVALSATLPLARTETARRPDEIPLPTTMSDRYAGAFDATLEPHGRATIVLREGWSDGWRASLDGKDLGSPILADGYAAGWILDAQAKTSKLSIRYAPATPYFALLALSWLLLLAVALAGASSPSRAAQSVTRPTVKVTGDVRSS